MDFKDKTNRRSKGGRPNGTGGKGRNFRKGGGGLKSKIVDFFTRNERKRYDAPKLAHKLRLKISYAEIDKALFELAEKGILKASGQGKYKIAKASAKRIEMVMHSSLLKDSKKMFLFKADDCVER